MDHQVRRGRGGVENQGVATHVEGAVDLAQRPTPLPGRDSRAGQHIVERDRLVQWRQPQLRCVRSVVGQLVADGGDQLARRQHLDVGAVVDDDGVRFRVHPAGGEHLRLGDRVHDDRPVHSWRLVDAVDVGAAELDRQCARRGDEEPHALVLPARLDVVGVLHPDDLPGHAGAGHFQTDAVGRVLVDVLDPAHVQRLGREEQVDAERAALAGDIVEQVGVLGVIGEHQGELVGHHEQRRDRWQVVSLGDGVLVFGDRVERAALHPAAGLFEQLLAPGDLAAQRVGEPVCQRTFLGHVGDDGDDLREVAEDVRSRLTLEVGVDDDEPVGGVGGQQRQQDRHQCLGLARAGHPDHQPVRTHAALGFVLEVEVQRFAGGGDADRHPQLVVAVAGGPQRGHVRRRGVRDAEQRGEGRTARGGRAAMAGIGIPAREPASEVPGLGGVEPVGGVDVGGPAAGLPPLDPAVGDPQDGPLGIRVLLAVRFGDSPMDDGDPGGIHSPGQFVGVGVWIVEHEQQVLDAFAAVTGERSPISEGGGQQPAQRCGVGRQITRGTDPVDLAGHIDMGQPLQPRPAVIVQFRPCVADSEHRGVVPGHRLGQPGADSAVDLVGVADHGDSRDLGQVDTGRRVVQGPLGVEQAAQGGVRHRFQVDLLSGVLDPQRRVEGLVVQAGAQHQEVAVAGIALPLPAGARHPGQHRRVRM